MAATRRDLADSTGPMHPAVVQAMRWSESQAHPPLDLTELAKELLLAPATSYSYSSRPLTSRPWPTWPGIGSRPPPSCCTPPASDSDRPDRQSFARSSAIIAHLAKRRRRCARSARILTVRHQLEPSTTQVLLPRQPSVRTPNFAPDGRDPPGETPVGTAVGRHLLARRCSPAQPYAA